ncbi:MAG TPA: hypothetical protein VIV59_13665, partial [Anaeromyxobacteraceae bacterium]
DSGSMATKQQILASNFAGFIDQLALLPAKNDYQVAVTTTSVDRWVSGTTPATAVFANKFSSPGGPTCNPAPNGGADYPAGALVRVVGTADVCSRQQFTVGTPRVLPAGSPTLIADFMENVYVGADGSGKEQGLEAARLAVSDPLASGANAGFLRPGARLVLIIVSDDDDCSDPLHAGFDNEPPGCTSYPVQTYVDFFKGPIAGEQRDVLVAGIISVDPATKNAAACAVQSAQPTCAPTATTAEHAAPRYKAFVDAFDPLNVDSVCNCTFETTLTRVATLIGQEVPLAAEPADWRLLTVSVTKPGGRTIPCTLGASGVGGTPDVIYAPPTATRPGTLTFGGTTAVSGACALRAGDQIDLKILCAG